MKEHRVAEAIRSARTIDELVTSLEALGIRTDDRRKLRRYLRRCWRNANAGRVDALLSVPPEPAHVLAGTTVRRDGVRYVVHGIAHGQRRFARLADAARDAIAAHVVTFDEPGASAIATERGMARLLGLDRSVELDYGRALLAALGGRAVAGFVLRAAVFALLLPFAGVFMRLSRDPLTRLLPKALSDVAYLATLRAVYEARELPPAVEVPLVTGSDRVRVEHSRAIAASAVERAWDLEVSELHLIVGVGHESEVAWFLEGSASSTTAA